MNKQDRIDLFSSLLRELEVDAGTSDMALLVFDALRDAIQSLGVKSNQEFYEAFRELVEIILKTEPKYAILNYYTLQLLEDFEALNKKEEIDYKQWAIDRVTSIHEEMKKRTESIIENADQLSFQGKTILLHDHSHTVHRVLQDQKKKGKVFKVVVAEQDPEKTHENIEVLHNAGIPFQVVPDYMLSHIHKNIDMVFYGALTLKDTMDFVMDPGTFGVISQFNTMNIPVYVFIKTTKFSYWKSKPRGEVYFKKHQRKHKNQPIEYERLKYSHDRVPAKLFEGIITNEGLFTPEQLEELYKRNYLQYDTSGAVE